MTRQQVASKESSEDASRSRPVASVTQEHINRLIGHSFLDLDKLVAWESGRVLAGLTIEVSEDGWAARIKSYKNGKAFVAFLGGPSYSETVELVAEFADRGLLEWREDRYPNKFVKKLLSSLYPKGGIL